MVRLQGKIDYRGISSKENRLAGNVHTSASADDCQNLNPKLINPTCFVACDNAIMMCGRVVRVLLSANDGTLDPWMFVNICKSIELLQSTLLPLSTPWRAAVVGKVNWRAESGNCQACACLWNVTCCHAQSGVTESQPS